jgi:methionyl-tRNA formyltransferase
MRILFMGNNWVGWQIVEWLREQGEDIVGLVVHPAHKRKYGDEIISAAVLPPNVVFDGSTLRQPEVMEAIAELKPEIALSVLFGYILRADFINIFKLGVINLHPALLPYNRGAYPNVWSIVDQTPVGVTLHYIDPGIDTGEIIAQQEVKVEPIDTGKSLYQKLEQASLALFNEIWPHIKANEINRFHQNLETGTFHRAADVEKIDEIDLDRNYTARELINVLRARTFPPYRGAYFMHEGRKVFLQLNLSYQNEVLEVSENEFGD